MKRTNLDDIYCSPIVFLGLMRATMKEVGSTVINHRKYKALREAWVASLYLLAASQATGKAWWIRANPEDVAPDCFAFAVEHESETGMRVGANISLEILELHENSKFGLVDTMRHKLEGLHAEKFIVIGYLRRTLTEEDVEGFDRAFEGLNFKVSEVVLLGRRGTGHIILKVYPEFGWLPVPQQLPSAYKGIPYDFVSKMRTLKVDENGWAGDGGEYSIDSELNFRKIDD